MYLYYKNASIDKDRYVPRVATIISNRVGAVASDRTTTCTDINFDFSNNYCAPESQLRGYYYLILLEAAHMPNTLIII